MYRILRSLERAALCRLAMMRLARLGSILARSSTEMPPWLAADLRIGASCLPKLRSSSTSSLMSTSPGAEKRGGEWRPEPDGPAVSSACSSTVGCKLRKTRCRSSSSVDSSAYESVLTICAAKLTPSSEDVSLTARLWCPPLPLSLACMGLLRGLHAGGARVREGTAGEKAGSGGAGEAGALAAAASEKQPLSAQPSTLKLADAVSLTPPARCCCCCCRPASAAASASVSDPRGISSLWSMASAMLADCLREGRGRWVRGEGVRQLALSGRRRRQKPSGCQSR
mmetsp:Transcript_33002/g.84321  ORF Transcript_33002/g.84321 Transcript_33002/m.84321 type:complete len:283 (+) Transcript_33002:1795-2643(+)